MKLKNCSETLAVVDALFKARGYTPLPEPVRECEIDGRRVPFDYLAKSSQRTLDEAIAFYDNAVYIGSGCRTWYDGVLCDWDETQHFFIKK